MTRLKKWMNKQKKVEPYLIAKAEKYLSRQLKINKKYLEFMEVWVPGFHGKVFLQFMILDPNSNMYGSTATYELEDKDK